MIRSLISEIKEFKKPSILASLFMVFEVMFEISIPFVMASLLDLMAPMHRLVLLKTFVGPFSKRFKPSHLRILISSHQVG